MRGIGDDLRIDPEAQRFDTQFIKDPADNFVNRTFVDNFKKFQLIKQSADYCTRKTMSLTSNMDSSHEAAFNNCLKKFN